jgi:Ice-binding-like
MVRPNVRFALFVPLAAFLLAWGSTSTASGATAAPSVGAAGSFAVLAGTAVTCTNGTVTGNVGVSPGTAITQTTCPVTGTINAGNAAAVLANRDFFAAYDKFKALACDQTFTTTTLGNRTFAPGVYCFDAALTSTGGVLTLDGPANGVWIFKIGVRGTGALTGTGFKVVTASGATPPCNSVYWWVAEAVTMTDSTFVGTTLAGAATTLTGGTFNGDAFAKAAVTVTGTAAVSACAIGNAAPPACKDRDRDKDKCSDKGKDKKHGDDDCDDDDDDHDDGDHHRKHEEYRR